MLKYLCFLTPLILWSEEISIGVEQYNGLSKYTVSSSTEKLKSELRFPFDLQIANIGLTHQIDNINIELKLSTPINKTTTTGKDYDWYQNELTVLSSSDNKVQKFNLFDLALSYPITEDFYIFSNLKYQTTKMSWSNTKQYNYIKEESSIIKDTSLEYQEKFYQLNLGLSHQKEFNDIKLYTSTSLIYAYVENRDRHILRHFYTKQESRAIGYGIVAQISKDISQNSLLALSFSYEEYSDNHTDMRYFNTLGTKYMSLNSSFNYINRVFGIQYRYNF